MAHRDTWFTTEEDFLEHIQKEHPDVTGTQLAMVMGVGIKFVTNPFKRLLSPVEGQPIVCLFCCEPISEEQATEHLAGHLETIALLSLPPEEGTRQLGEEMLPLRKSEDPGAKNGKSQEFDQRLYPTLSTGSTITSDRIEGSGFRTRATDKIGYDEVVWKYIDAGTWSSPPKPQPRSREGPKASSKEASAPWSMG